MLMGGLRGVKNLLLEGKRKHRWKRSTYGRTEKNREGSVNETHNDRTITG